MDGKTLDLSGAWDKFWGNITGGNFGNFLMLLAIIGMLIVVFGIIKFLWEKRRGGGGNNNALIWTIVVGALLAAPALVIPLLLNVIDILVNAIVKVLQGSV